MSEQQRIPSEQQPLLGEPGDAMQPEGDTVLKNFYLGTAVLAQAGIWVLVAIIWGAVFSSDLTLFSAHPLLQSAAVLFYVQAVLVLQPTYTAGQKRAGTLYHAGLNNLATLSAIAGLVIIEYNKGDHARFTSVHGRLGLVTYILVFVQAAIGATMYFAPSLYGSVDNAKSIYKYHRASGYAALILMLATVCAATQTDFNVKMLGIQLWAVIVCSVLILVGILPRVRKAKFGL